jgi:fatty-acyl-CoA synthase
MHSTMADYPLTVTPILRYGTGCHAHRRVLTATADGYREIGFGPLGERVAQLAHGLRGIGITGDQRVATFMWNNQGHLEAYLAIPCMGAVLHTLNIRLAGVQIAYIANQAEDQVVIADLSLAPLLAALLATLTTVHTVVAVGQGNLDPLTASGKTVVGYDNLIGRQATEFDWPDLDVKSAAACVTPAERPARRKVSSIATARRSCIRWQPAPPSRSRAANLIRRRHSRNPKAPTPKPRLFRSD